PLPRPPPGAKRGGDEVFIHPAFLFGKSDPSDPFKTGKPGEVAQLRSVRSSSPLSSLCARRRFTTTAGATSGPCVARSTSEIEQQRPEALSDKASRLECDSKTLTARGGAIMKIMTSI